MNTIHTITLKTTSGVYVADYNTAASDARNHTHRQLLRRCADFWPELWGSSDKRSSGYPLNDERRDWRRWLKSLDKLTLAVILNQK